MNTLDQKLDFTFTANQQIIQLIAEIDLFRGKWEHLEQLRPVFLKELKGMATIQSIGSSTRIEGATLSDAEIEQLIADLKVNKLENRDEQEVIGYYDVLELIFDNAEDIHLTENYIMQLHTVLLRYSTKDSGQKGAYKKVSNKVVASYPDGTQRVIFNTTEPYLVQKEMQELLSWTNKRLENLEYHPLLVVGLLIYEFLSIHPFHDGNGRLSRLLTTLLLIKLDYDFIQYISFEHIIENRKERYYAALMECQRKRNTEKECVDTWMLFFLNALKMVTVKLSLKMNNSGG
ncbi:Fic/DOC family protein [Candidatus Electrothrix marina]|uniref:Fic/DOC family protein n=1 Tax=Candidatus Electrothrix marina TaxID=1859130 RepID=A0A444JEH4_9BACT|nr:Fic/DOC family protein [Candidatus Electrothrix marina]